MHENTIKLCITLLKFYLKSDNQAILEIDSKLKFHALNT